MKRLLTVLVLATSIYFGESFKPNRGPSAEQLKSDGYIMAVIDGKVFEARDENWYSAQLKNKSTENQLFASTDNAARISRVASVLNFYGADFQDADGNLFKESIGVEYTFNNGALGEGADKRITLNYNDQKFSSIPGESILKVTRIEWSDDHRSYAMDADFDCKLRNWGAKSSSQQVVHLKGKMQNITVTVPSWIVLTSPAPAQVAETKE